MADISWWEIDSPVGGLLLADDARALTRIYFQSGRHPFTPPPAWRRSATPFAHARRELEEYFAGTRRTFSVPLAMQGTAYQRTVWQGLLGIPYGETISYGELARRIGSAPRAVGLANGANPLPIIVPCHRVIGADGSLTGFGGGLPVKRALLELEGAACVADLFSGPRAGPRAA
ncbi:MAG: methylated-DNA--[protein]-cysteine S-methyltransferase [Gammaproteobacteria bacterium]|nr:methylated-DNA--[protein]-cysteine S-methyltransferase [Gammaproteobacteria bacterium]